MKKLIIVSAIAISGLFYQNANAQIHFSINLGLRPVVVEHAPVYDADYYYLPDVGAYYSVSNNCYYYQDGGAWISATYLPGVYRNYDWRNERHFAVNEGRPYLHNDLYRTRFGGFEGHRDWNYRDERNERIYTDKEHFDHDQYRGHDYGRDYQRNEQCYDRNDHQQPAQPQQNNNCGNYGGRDDHQQPQSNNSRVNDHGNDNNNGGHDYRQGRGERF